MRLPTKTLVNRATIEPYAGSSARGPVYDDALENVKCRLDANETRTVQRGTSVQVVSKATMYVRPESRMPALSKITIDGTRYEALDVEPITGPFRVIGYKVALG